MRLPCLHSSTIGVHHRNRCSFTDEILSSSLCYCKSARVNFPLYFWFSSSPPPLPQAPLDSLLGLKKNRNKTYTKKPAHKKSKFIGRDNSHIIRTQNAKYACLLPLPPALLAVPSAIYKNKNNYELNKNSRRKNKPNKKCTHTRTSIHQMTERQKDKRQRFPIWKGEWKPSRSCHPPKRSGNAVLLPA